MSVCMCVCGFSPPSSPALCLCVFGGERFSLVILMLSWSGSVLTFGMLWHVSQVQDKLLLSSTLGEVMCYKIFSELSRSIDTLIHLYLSVCRETEANSPRATLVEPERLSRLTTWREQQQFYIVRQGHWEEINNQTMRPCLGGDLLCLSKFWMTRTTYALGHLIPAPSTPEQEFPNVRFFLLLQRMMVMFDQLNNLTGINRKCFVGELDTSFQFFHPHISELENLMVWICSTEGGFVPPVFI